jgi:hypothetical protein
MVNTYFCNTLAAVPAKVYKKPYAIGVNTINEAFIFTQQIPLEI